MTDLGVTMGRKRLDNTPVTVRLSPTVRQTLLDMATARRLTMADILRAALTAGVSVMAGGRAEDGKS